MRRLVLLIATLVACASLAACASAAAPKLSAVPGVVGMAEKDALRTLFARGFSAHVLFVHGRQGRADEVISQKPASGRFPVGTVIYIGVSTGPTHA